MYVNYLVYMAQLKIISALNSTYRVVASLWYRVSTRYWSNAVFSDCFSDIAVFAEFLGVQNPQCPPLLSSSTTKSNFLRNLYSLSFLLRSEFFAVVLQKTLSIYDLNIWKLHWSCRSWNVFLAVYHITDSKSFNVLRNLHLLSFQMAYFPCDISGRMFNVNVSSFIIRQQNELSWLQFTNLLNAHECAVDKHGMTMKCHWPWGQ